jgi:hypothetical protein
VVKVATPDALTADWPRLVLPSRRITVPVGELLDWGAATAAVKLTACPKLEGFGAAVRLVAVTAPVTTSVTTGEVLEAYLVLAL